MNNDTKHLVMTSIGLLFKCLFNTLAYLLKWMFVFLVLSSKNFLYTLNANIFTDICIVNTSSHSGTMLIIMYFKGNIFILIHFNLSIFCLCFLSVFLYLNLHIWPTTYFELIFLDGKGQYSYFKYEHSVIPIPFFKKNVLCLLLNYHNAMAKKQLNIYM